MELLRALIVIFVIIVPITNTNADLYDNKPKADEVGLYFSGVAIPVTKVILIRKKNHYCALKFTRTWSEMDEERLKVYAGSDKGTGTNGTSLR